MKILKPKQIKLDAKVSLLENALKNSDTKKVFFDRLNPIIVGMDKTTFYPFVCELLSKIGIEGARPIREGDVNCRFDAVIVNDVKSIPIEIKSPREDLEINIKSIRQAFENKIVLLSRKFYATTKEATSLAVALRYPPLRSDIYELIDDVKKCSNLNIGVVSTEDLLKVVFEKEKLGRCVNKSYFETLCGKFDYEKAFI